MLNFDPSIFDTHLREANDFGELGLVLSGGGSRTAYQIGALRALAPYMTLEPHRLSILVGSSIGAVNTVVLGSCMHLGLNQSLDVLEALWRERTFRNTFLGSPSRAFLKAIQVAIFRYSSPGPVATSLAIFNPEPLRQRVDIAIEENQLADSGRSGPVRAIGVMTTVEGKERKPLLFVSSPLQIDARRMLGATFALSYVDKLTAAHGLASAALPSVLPPVKLNAEAGQVHLVDGGISDNIPVDPAVRLGAERIITIDCSGRRWWFNQYGTPHDTRPRWEIAADEQTFCLCPSDSFEIASKTGFGEILKAAVGRSTRDFIAALGPTWPIFRILKHKMGETLAYEVMSYVALHPEYIAGLIELGKNETRQLLAKSIPLGFDQSVEDVTLSQQAA